MPDPNTTQSLPPGTEGGFSLQDAPGAELSLDELFPSEEGLKVEGGEGLTSEPTAPPAEPTKAPEPFIKTTTGTVYSSLDDTIRGTEEKDRLIAEYERRTGIKPGQLREPQATTPAAQPEQVRYLKDSRRFYKDMSDAVQRQDPDAWARTLQQYVYEILEPAVPLVLETAKERAIRGLEADIKDIRQFVASPEYQAFLDGFPALRQAIETGETNLEVAQQLPEFYRLAYFSARGRKVPEMVRAGAAPVVPAAAVRPTLQPVTSAPPTPDSTGGIKPPDKLDAIKERRAYLEDLERRGIKNVVWK